MRQHALLLKSICLLNESSDAQALWAFLRLSQYSEKQVDNIFVIRSLPILNVQWPVTRVSCLLAVVVLAKVSFIHQWFRLPLVEASVTIAVALMRWHAFYQSFFSRQHPNHPVQNICCQPLWSTGRNHRMPWEVAGDVPSRPERWRVSIEVFQGFSLSCRHVLHRWAQAFPWRTPSPVTSRGALRFVRLFELLTWALKNCKGGACANSCPNLTTWPRCNMLQLPFLRFNVFQRIYTHYLNYFILYIHTIIYIFAVYYILHTKYCIFDMFSNDFSLNTSPCYLVLFGLVLSCIVWHLFRKVQQNIKLCHHLHRHQNWTILSRLFRT